MQFLKRHLDIRMWHVLLGSFLIGLALAGIVVIAVVGLDKLGDFARTNRELAQANIRSINNNGRLDRIDADRNRARTREGTTAAVLRALRALRSCARDPVCRRRNPGVVRANRAISNIPTPPPDTSGSGSSSGGGSSGSGGGNSGSGTTPAPRRPPASPGPSRPSTPQPTTRPTPSRPAPAPSPPPASAPPAATAPRPAPPSVPQATTPPVGPVPPVTTPTVPPVVPPVTVPVPIQVCTPVIQVNCRRPNGRIVGPTGAAADPASNSGRGNLEDKPCERVKAPCDDAGAPVFPDGLIRFAVGIIR